MKKNKVKATTIAVPKPKSELSVVRPFHEQVIAAALSLKAPSEQVDIIKALVGGDGYSNRPLASDHAYIAHATEVLQSVLIRIQKDVGVELKWAKIIIYDDRAMTSIAQPIARTKSMIEGTTKQLKKVNMHGIGFTHCRALRPTPDNPDSDQLLSSCRLLVYAPADFDFEQAMNQFNRSRQFKNLATPRASVTPFTQADFADAANWLLQLSKLSVLKKTAKDGTNKFIKSPSEYGPSEALRVVEYLSQREFSELLFSVNDGKKQIGSLRKKLSSWHAGRVDGGNVLAAEFDVWAFWMQFWKAQDRTDLLPYRFDTVVKSLRLPALSHKKRQPMMQKNGRRKPSKFPPMRKSKSKSTEIVAE